MKRWILGFFLVCHLCVAVGEEKFRSLQERYDAMVSFFQEQKWIEVVREGKAISQEFSGSALSIESSYYLGAAYFQIEDYDLSNRYLSKYLKEIQDPQFFEAALAYKFLIAEHFREGAKKRLVLWEKSPKWLSAKQDALQIYEEILSSYPYDELGAKALFGKALIYEELKDYDLSLEAFATLIQRFPNHELAIESYLHRGNIYVRRCQEENLNPDWLDLAEMNLRKFSEAFPGEERLAEARQCRNQVQEAFAKNLYETALFYERTKKPQAALLYYEKIIQQFPHSDVAKLAEQRKDNIQASNL